MCFKSTRSAGGAGFEAARSREAVLRAVCAGVIHPQVQREGACRVARPEGHVANAATVPAVCGRQSHARPRAVWPALTSNTLRPSRRAWPLPVPGGWTQCRRVFAAQVEELLRTCFAAVNTAEQQQAEDGSARPPAPCPA